MYAAYSLYAKITGKNARDGTTKKQNPVIVFILIWLVSVIAYYLSTLVKYEGEWVNIGFILYFQPARLVGYTALFALGIYGYKKRWFTQAGWTPHWLFWGIITLLFTFLFIIWNYSIRWAFNESVNRWTSAVSYNSIALLSTLFLTGLFFRFQKMLGKLTFYFSPYSYGIYWLHLIVLVPVLYLIKPYPIHLLIKWSFAILFTLIACRLLSKYVLKKTKLF
jgi:membrane-bound acyltransferase YfiQ involved in biofilm formation